MGTEEEIFKLLKKNGFAEKNGNKSWDIAERRVIYIDDDLAKGFLSFRDSDIYNKAVMEREVGLITKHAKKIVEDIGEEPFNLIDIYCGDGKKACEFIKALKSNTKIRYCPVNANKHLVDLAVENVKSENFKNVIEFEPIVSNGDGRTLSKLSKKLKKGDFCRGVFLLLGSVVASYEINDFLFELSKDLKKDDYLVIGNGIRTGERLVSIGTYKHPLWNEWFTPLMKAIGYSEDEVEYDARFGNSRVEMFYNLKANKTVKQGNKKIDFKIGDEIVVAVLYKYFEEEFDKFCKMYFSQADVYKDSDDEYALVLCKK